MADLPMLSDWKQKRLLNQQYRLVGNHSSVKICFWCRHALWGDGHCYKQDFYGVDTLRCVEMSPALTCNQRCKHCWRDTSVFSRGWVGPVDEPQDIVDGCIAERRKLLIGFKGSYKVKPELFEKAMTPVHAAISLTGEPCLYPKLPELVKEFFSRDFKTVFLVTNGTCPDMLERFKTERCPTNIYLSLEAPTEDDYIKFCIPTMENSYSLVKKSQLVLKELRGRTRTVMRITCVKDFNMHKAKEFVEHVKRMEPDVIECKGFMHMGYAQFRLERSQSPSHEEVQVFANELAELTGYKFNDEVKRSTIVMLVRPEYNS